MADVEDLKLISYRGGLVNFYIPSNWIEEYESDGGGTFYEDKPNSGTLRLNVLTFEGKSESNDISPIDFLANLEFAKAGKISSLPNGNAMLEYHKDSREEDESLKIYYWQIVNILQPNHGRIAVFSYTILATQENDPAISSELRVIKEQIPKAMFALELGQ